MPLTPPFTSSSKTRPATIPNTRIKIAKGVCIWSRTASEKEIHDSAYADTEARQVIVEFRAGGWEMTKRHSQAGGNLRRHSPLRVPVEQASRRSNGWNLFILGNDLRTNKPRFRRKSPCLSSRNGLRRSCSSPSTGFSRKKTRSAALISKSISRKQEVIRSRPTRIAFGEYESAEREFRRALAILQRTLAACGASLDS